jgi:hypothetical protein
MKEKRKLIVLVFSVLMTVGTLWGQAAGPFLGKWDIMGKTEKETYVFWLEVSAQEGKLAGQFLNRSGSVLPLPEIALEKNELVFSIGQDPKNPQKPKPVHRAVVKDGKLIGSLDNGKETISWVGVRPPKWKSYDANGSHRYGKAIDLFDSRGLSGWVLQYPSRPSGWSVVDGILQNEPHANNIISEQKFKDFKLQVEYKLEPKSNSGIYLRGRYEMQVLDDSGSAPNKHSHMSVYSRVAPSANPSKPAGEWQSVEIILVGNRVTALLNGQKVQDNTLIEGITGGALDSQEGEPGPLMIQGDHGRIWIRKVVITPIL